MRNAFLLAAALLVAAVSTAHAGSASATLSITIQAPFKITVIPANPSIACNAAPGTPVAALSMTGGDGNPVTYAAGGGDTSDFAVSGSNVVVGPNGIAAANCPAIGQTSTQTLTVTATQP